MQVILDTTNAGSALNTALTTNVDPNTIISEFISVLPWVGSLIVVAFLIYMARKLLKGAAKGKVRV